MEREWFYVTEEQEAGPVSEAELTALFEHGRLHEGTPLWTEGLAEWTPARECGDLLPIREMQPSPAIPTPSAALGAGFVVSGSQVQPWVRYFARFIDYVFFGVFGGCVAGALFPSIFELPQFVFTVALVFVYTAFEGTMLAALGTTPGKALLRTRVRRKDGSRLDFGEGFSRSFDVCVRGVGLGIPLITLFTQVVAYQKLRKQGETSWDASGGYVVQHARIGPLNYIGVGLVVAAIIGLLVAGSMQP